MNESVLRDLCQQYGVDYDLPETSIPLRQRDLGEMLMRTGGTSVDEVRRMAATEIDEEDGEPGTSITDGRVRPAVGKYGSRAVRGTHGRWGLYEEHFRSDPQIYDPVTSITEALAAATYEVVQPKQVQPSQEQAVAEFVDWSNAWLHSLQGGIRRHVAEAGEALLIYGCVVHEVVWGADERGRKHPAKLGYREPSTYDEWVLDEDRASLDGLLFEPDDGPQYLLGHGDDLRADVRTAAPTRKMIHAAFHQRGLNFDGVPPQRPAISFKKLKKLLLQIAGLAADKYGVPVPTVVDAPVEVTGPHSPADGTADASDKDDLYRLVANQRSGEAPVYKIPAGLEIDYLEPQGSMPTLLDLLEYCDQQIAQSYKNEGALLGQQSAVGSYALGQVADDKFLRKAPAVARSVLQPLEDIIRLQAQAYLEAALGRPLPAYPTIQMRLGAQIDTTQWVADMQKLMGGQPVTRWPETLQKAALDKMDLPEDALEAGGDEEIAAPESTEEGAGDAR